MAASSSARRRGQSSRVFTWVPSLKRKGSGSPLITGNCSTGGNAAPTTAGASAADAAIDRVDRESVIRNRSARLLINGTLTASGRYKITVAFNRQQAAGVPTIDHAS